MLGVGPRLLVLSHVGISTVIIGKQAAFFTAFIKWRIQCALSPVSVTAIVRRGSSNPYPHTKLPRGTAVLGTGAATGHEKDLQSGVKLG